MVNNMVAAALGKLAEIERIIKSHGIFEDSQRSQSDPSGGWDKQWFNNSKNNSHLFWQILYFLNPEQCVVSFKLSEDDGHGLGVAYVSEEDQWKTCHEDPDRTLPGLRILANRFPQGALTERQAFELISCLTVYHARRKGTSAAVSP